MRENLPFDDYVKQQFSGYSPDVPEHIWENIIAKRKENPKGFWISLLSSSNFRLISLLILVAGGTAWYLISSNNSGTNKNNTPVENIAVEKSNAPGKDSKTTTGTITSPQSAANATDRSVIPEKNGSDNIVPDDNILPGNISPSAKDESSSDQNIFYKPVRNRGTVNRETLANDLQMSKEENASVIENNREVAATILNSPFRFNNARELSTNRISNSRNVKLPDCPTLEKNAAGNKKYWEAYAGPDYAFENYKSYGDTQSSNYLEKRKASTRFASAFSAGVRYTKVFNNGTSIRAGLNYSQINEKFLYFNPNEIKFVTVITTRVVIRAPGDTIYINDTLQYQQTGTRVKTTYNRYRNVDIPLVIGYELGNGKIHANINAGVIINVYSWYKGDVLDSLYQPVSITTGKGSSIYQFKNNIGVGFLGSISLYYKLTDDLHLMLEPYFRYNLSPMSKENLNLQQKYNTAGLRAGIRFDLK